MMNSAKNRKKFVQKERRIQPHGGNREAFCRQYRIDFDDVIDFSANINPFGPPAGLYERISSELDSITHYPDPTYQRLRESLGKFYGVSPESIVVGNGATELIHLVISALNLRRICIPVPTFSEYESAARRKKSKVLYFPLKEDTDFALAFEELTDFCMIDEPSDAIIICNPNSPAGTLVEREDSVKFVKKAYQEDKSVIIDEAFIELTPCGEEKNSLINSVNEFDNLLVIRSMTKAFSLPGLRLGFVVGSRSIISRLSEQMYPWNVNSLAEVAGQYCLTQYEWLSDCRRKIHAEKKWLESKLKHLSGIKVYDSAANFLLLRLTSDDIDAFYVSDALGKKGIMIRNCSNYVGLDKRFLRIAVLNRESNLRLVSEMRDFSNS